MLVTFWGTRGSISTPGPQTEKYGGNTSCVCVRHGSTIIVLDAGTGIRELGLRLMREHKNTGQPLDIHLLLSHTHWDHIQGLPFFSPAYLPEAKINIYGSPAKGRFLASILEGQMDTEYFPVSMGEWAAKVSIREIKNHRITVDGLEIVSEEQKYHPGGSVRFSISSGKARIVYASDIELNSFIPAEICDEAGRKDAKAYKNFIRNADLLIGDGQYSDEEYKRCIGWGHTSMSLLADTAADCNVRRLAVFHHDPQHSDQYLDRAGMRLTPFYSEGDNPMSLFWAREGLTLAVGV